MGKLVLTSRGLETKVGKELIGYEVKGKTKGKTILVVDLAYYGVTEVLVNACVQIGFGRKNIIVASSETDQSVLVDYVYVTAGNTFLILDWIRKNNLATYIQKCVANGAVYIGASAGAIIAGTDIECALDFDLNKVGMTIFTALRLFEGTILPHYDKTEYLEKYIQNSDKELISKYKEMFYVGEYESFVIDTDTGEKIRHHCGEHIFFSSDYHFDHENAIKFTNRPYENAEQMNEALIENINQVVGTTDELYILGDISFTMGKEEQIQLRKKIKCKHLHLIRGNHDCKWSLDDGMFESVQDYKELKTVFDKKLVLFHYPIADWNGKYYGAIHLHGHIHSTGEYNENNLAQTANDSFDAGHKSEEDPGLRLRRYDVGVDANDYKPVSLAQIAMLMELWRIRTVNKNEIERYSFEDFVDADSNRFACFLSKAIVQQSGEFYNTIFIHGGAGLGKSHLLTAIEKEARKCYPQKKIVHTTGEKFTNDLGEAIKEGRKPGNVDARDNFKKTYRNIDVLIVDDIQFIEGKMNTQSEFLHTMDALVMGGKQVIMSSSVSPNQMVELDERLRSRFQAGVVVEVEPPNYSDRIKIAKHVASREDCEELLSDEDVEFVALNIKMNIRTLEGAINKLIALRRLERENNQQIKSAEEALADMIDKERSNKVSSEMIMDEVSKCFHVSTSELKGKNRAYNIVLARHVSMYLMSKLIEDATASQIAVVMKKNHSSVIYALKRVDELMQEDLTLANTVHKLIRTLEVE